MTSEQQTAFKRRITAGNRTEIINVLYEMYFVYAEDGANAMANSDLAAAHDALRHAEQVVLHLKQALDFKYELSSELYPLYDFVQRALARSNYKADTSGIEEAGRIMKPLQEAFFEISKADDSAPMMRHTENLVAGMTYGKNDVSEVASHYDSNRGFLA